MLGLRKRECGWRFAAAGKHPAAKEFLNLGARFPLFESVAEWAARGYAGEGSVLAHGSGNCWLFWMAGSAPEQVACGMLRDSSDSIGRPFPFLVMGEGPAAGWREEWELLPSFCDGSWSRMLSLCCCSFADFARLGVAVASLKAPAEDLREFRKRKENQGAPLPAEGGEPVRVRQDPGNFTWVHLSSAGAFPGADAVSAAGRLLREQDHLAPTAVFIGGMRGHFRYLVFRRALRSADFIKLWSKP